MRTKLSSAKLRSGRKLPTTRTGKHHLTQRQKYETSYSDKWDGILLSHTPFLQEELDERDELEAEVKDPTFVLRAAEEQADEAEENPDVTMESPKQEVSELQVADS